MLRTPSVPPHPSQSLNPAELFETECSPSTIRSQFSSFDGFTNPFLAPSAQQQHACYENSSLVTPPLKPGSVSYTSFPEPPTLDLESHLPRNDSSSSSLLAFGDTVSYFQPQYLYPSVCQPPVATASSPPISSSQFTQHTTLITPDRLNVLVASPLPSWRKLLNETPPFSLSTTPFRLFREIDLPPPFEPQSSPVVRRSLGDVTPIYNHRGDADAHGHLGIVAHRLSRDTEQGDRLEEKDSCSRSPSLGQKTPSTPFLQKLRRTTDLPQKQPSVHSARKRAPPLASPFTPKAMSSPANESYTFPSPSRSPAENVPMSNFNMNDLKSYMRPEPPSEQDLAVGISSSPLSELSAITPSPLPFKEKDRKTRMKTRSARHKLSPKPNFPAARKQTLKRKFADRKNPLILARLDDSADDVDTSPPRKKRILEEVISPSLRASRWIMSKGAGPATFSAKARSDGGIQTSSSNAPGDLASSSHKIQAGDSLPSPAEPYWQRKFPSTIPIHSLFPNFYRKFPVSSFFYPAGAVKSVLVEEKSPTAPKGHARVNVPRSAYDLYTPRFTKGIGHSKQGLCPLCFESVERGGANLQEWLSMKFSAYKCYHMQYFHGISPTTGQPFSPPIAFRTNARTQVRKLEKSEVLEGKCHKCLKWVPVEGVKIGTVNVKELFWWKHAAVCHKTSRLPGDSDVFVKDDVFRRLKAYEASSSTTNEDVLSEDE